MVFCVTESEHCDRNLPSTTLGSVYIVNIEIAAVYKVPNIIQIV